MVGLRKVGGDLLGNDSVLSETSAAPSAPAACCLAQRLLQRHHVSKLELMEPVPNDVQLCSCPHEIPHGRAEDLHMSGCRDVPNCINMCEIRKINKQSTGRASQQLAPLALTMMATGAPAPMVVAPGPARSLHPVQMQRTLERPSPKVG